MRSSIPTAKLGTTESRNPKQIQNPKSKMEPGFWISGFGFVSDFEIRISDFPAGASDFTPGDNMSASGEIYSPGLEGVIAGETAISTVTGGLRYRGYPVTELAEKCNFEQVAYLLLHGELPTRSQLGAISASAWRRHKNCPRLISEVLKKAAKPRPCQWTWCGPASACWPISIRKRRTTATTPTCANRNGCWRRFRSSSREHASGDARGCRQCRRGRIWASRRTCCTCSRARRRASSRRRAFDVSLILYAEHEFNASTFTARVVMSTDPTCIRPSSRPSAR